MTGIDEILASSETTANLADTLDELVKFVRRFVVLSGWQSEVLALWIAHTWALPAADTTPYIAVPSAAKRSGKTRLLEVLELLVREPLPTSNISDAALFRAIAELDGPTVMLDEIDAIFGPKARDREDLRGMLNAGYRRGAVVRRMGGARMTTLEAFPVFCPKIFAGIGELPDTLSDRSIRVRLERRTRDEPVERFRRRDAAAKAEPIRASLENLMAQHLDTLSEARPMLPDELDDRQQDGWEPLLAIADLTGEEWARRARRAALELSDPTTREDDSLSTRLLADIFHVFTTSKAERFKTDALIAELAEIEESPWGDWFGKTITAQTLSKFLKPFRIRTMPVWVGAKTVRGYKVEQFDDAWLRFLGVTRVRGVSGVRDGTAPTNEPNAPNAPNAKHTGEEENQADDGRDEWLERIAEDEAERLLAIGEEHGLA